ncbi:uncharacterized protein LOC106732037 [Pelodiscus sinensis]|uniref:uncharacterized protein LOC106732037 n=1 Tax=Pelodiscus sinensis TaxID=13735 RepID=UPI003F6AC115
MKAEEATPCEAISEDRRRLISVSSRRQQGSLAAAVAQCLSLAVMCTAGAYPSWVLVSGKEIQFVLGAAWVMNPREPAPNSPLLGRTGGGLMISIAVCCILAILCGYGALVLDFLGLRRGRVVAPLLHGVVALLAAGAAAVCSCLFQLTRSRLQTEKELNSLGLSSTPGPSFFLAILACALAGIATALSCSASARVGPAAGRSALGRVRRNEIPSFEGEVEEASETERSLDAWKQETAARKERVVALVQGEREPGMAGSLDFIQREIEFRMAGSRPFTQEQIEPRMAGSLPLLQGETESAMAGSLPLLQGETESAMAGRLPFLQTETEPPMAGSLPFLQGEIDTPVAGSQSLFTRGETESPMVEEGLVHGSS